MADTMFAHNPFVPEILSGNLAVLWRTFQAPAVGALVALGCTLAGRWLRWPVLVAAAASLGIALAWLLLARQSATASPPAKLLFIALAGAVLGPLAVRLLPRHAPQACLIVLAVGGGWWLAGAPHRLPASLSAAAVPVAAILVLGLGGRHLARGHAWRLVLAGASLCGALWIAKAPTVWILSAMAPALATTALFATPATAELLVLPVAIDILAVAVAVLLTAGRLPRLGLGAMDVAAAAPILAPLLAPRLRVAEPLAGLLAGAIAILLALAARMWLPA